VTSYWSSIVTLITSCRVSKILELSYAESRFFDTSPLFRSKFQRVPPGVDPCGCKEGTPQLANGEIIFGRIPTYVITIPQRHGRTDRRLCRSNTALCVASRGKNWRHGRTDIQTDRPTDRRTGLQYLMRPQEGHIIKQLKGFYWLCCYFTVLATRKWLYPVLAIWPVFFSHTVTLMFILANKFIK